MGEDDAKKPDSRDQTQPEREAPQALDAKAEAKAKEKAASKAKAAHEAAVAAAMPELDAVLQQTGLTKEERTDWLGHLQTLPVAEAEVLAIVAPAEVAPGPSRWATFRRNLTLARHGFTRWRRDGNMVWRILYIAGWLYLLVASAVKLNNWLGWLSAIGVIGTKGRFVLRDMQPKHRLLVSRGYNERKVSLTRLIETLQRWEGRKPHADEVMSFRREALALIAGYVRDHRARFGSKEILANLLVRRGERVAVIGRSDPLRPVPQFYEKEECSLAWEAFETCSPKLSGDIYADCPTTKPGKKYCSVLVLPVWFRDEVLGVVSIDSRDKYHFHLDYDDLQVQLAPYVQLLARTLSDDHDTKQIPAGSGEAP